MKKIEFYKYQGAGNDFVIIDNRNNAVVLSNEEVNFLCDRRFGIGADGLMLLNTLEGYDFAMQYYNSDGNEASMCGNGGRCLTQFAKDVGIEKDTYSFIAIDGPHLANFDHQGWVRLKMKDVNGITNDNGDRVLDTGSPHYIKIVDNASKYDVVANGKEIRYSADYKEKGINVNFVEVMNDKIIVRTYERGVEDETFSCGTGVTASALVCANNPQGFNHVDIQTLGGNLAVEFEKKGDTVFENIWLCGPATFVFKGSIELDDDK